MTRRRIDIKNYRNFEKWYFEDWHHYDKKRLAIHRLYHAVLSWANKFASFDLLHGKGKAALDVGCAHGYTVELLSHFGYDAYGCDISRLYLGSYARKIARNLVLCDASKLPFFERSFDIITAFELLEHLGNQYKFLTSCHDCLKPKGVLVLQTPRAIPSIDAVLSKIYARAVSKSYSVEHHIGTITDKSNLGHLLDRCGFTYHVETWFLLPLNPTTFNRYFPTRIPMIVPTFRTVATRRN